MYRSACLRSNEFIAKAHEMKDLNLRFPRIFKNRFKKRKPDTNLVQSPESLRAVTLIEETVSVNTLGSDQLYEQVFPEHFQSVHEARHFTMGGTDLRLFGRRLDRSTSYDSLCFSTSTASELTSVADRSFDMTLLHSFDNSRDHDSLSVVREQLGLNSNRLASNKNSDSESEYDTLDHVTPRPWPVVSGHVVGNLLQQRKGIQRQLSFSELTSTPPKKTPKANTLERMPLPVQAQQCTPKPTPQSYASEVLQRMMSRYEGDSPNSADSSIEMSRGSLSTRRSFGIYNSPASSYNTVHSTASSRNTDALYQQASDLYGHSPTTNTTSSNGSYLPPPLNTPNISPEDSTHDNDCIIAPPMAFRDSPQSKKEDQKFSRRPVSAL